MLESIHDILNPSQTQGACRILSICGLGGIQERHKPPSSLHIEALASSTLFCRPRQILYSSWILPTYALFASALELMNEEELKKSQRLKVIKDVQH